jgi:hypothetical protein
MTVTTRHLALQSGFNDFISKIKKVDSISDFLDVIKQTSLKIIEAIVEYCKSMSLKSRTLDLKTIAIIACVSTALLFFVALFRTKSKQTGINSPSALSPVPMRRASSAPPCHLQ